MFRLGKFSSVHRGVATVDSLDLPCRGGAEMRRPQFPLRMHWAISRLRYCSHLLGIHHGLSFAIIVAGVKRQSERTVAARACARPLTSCWGLVATPSHPQTGWRS